MIDKKSVILTKKVIWYVMKDYKNVNAKIKIIKNCTCYWDKYMYIYTRLAWLAYPMLDGTEVVGCESTSQ